MLFYVYILRDPRKNNEPFYVGKGKGDRAFCHTRGLDTYNSYNKMKTGVIKKILKENLEVKVDFEYIDLEEEEAHRLEKMLITKIGRRDLGLGPLTNLTDGGEGFAGYIATDIAKKHMSESHLGKKLTEEHKENQRRAHFGVPKTKEHSENIRRAKLGKLNPMFGKPSPRKNKPANYSIEVLEKIKTARAKQVFSKESIQKRSEKLKNYTVYIWKKGIEEIEDTSHGMASRFPNELFIFGLRYAIRNRDKTYKGWKVFEASPTMN